MAKAEKTCGREGRPWTRVLTGLGSQGLSFKVRLSGEAPDPQIKQSRGQRAEGNGPRAGEVKPLFTCKLLGKYRTRETTLPRLKTLRLSKHLNIKH